MLSAVAAARAENGCRALQDTRSPGLQIRRVAQSEFPVSVLTKLAG